MATASPFADNPDVAAEERNEILVAGPIVELRTVNPHVVLIIEGTGAISDYITLPAQSVPVV